MLMVGIQTAKKMWHSQLTRVKNYDVTARDAQKARSYISRYWSKLTRYQPKDTDSLIGLPYRYLVPSHSEEHNFDFNEMYYWDSYFMVQGMLDLEHQELVMGILNNQLELIKRFKMVPNATRTYLTGRSQPPFLTSFIFDVYDTYALDNKWLARSIALAKDEYQTVWMGEEKPNWRQVHLGLSRYYDINMLHDLAEAESGWDMNPRFHRRALDYLPVDLNALLYKYEVDFARAAEILDKAEEAADWHKRAMKRADMMRQLMWSNMKGLYYDYNYTKEKRSNVASLATFFPMWAGMVSPKQAASLVKALRRFEYNGGLATTESPPSHSYLPNKIPNQWAYPNGWAPLHFLVIQALEKHGYHDDARRIAMKWLRNNLDWFNTHGVFIEKYNVVQPNKPPIKGHYPTQVGFGWTNAVFERLCREYLD